MIAPPKLMLPVRWASAGFHFVDHLPMRVTFCFAYYLFQVMDRQSADLQPDRQHPFRKLLIHADDACVHPLKLAGEYFKSHSFQGADHPPHSPNLASSDIFLPAFVKGQLKRRTFPMDTVRYVK
jgi:hypothetical protein